ncbi:response regulator [Candidatus Sodalis pierantonius]|uniref:response regulator n=1 Tax=Candidatus Sodalis pierantonii TaxID=1486991 RepID=UPI001EFF8AB1|nr:response regulator [Candidatus Sodalis pierantonius]
MTSWLLGSRVMKILVIEDDKLLREGLRQALEQERFACECATDLRQSESLLGAMSYSLIILDLGLPDGDGMTLLEQLRRRGNDVPVLILTARDAIDERVRGLETLYTILCKCLFSEVIVQAVTELDNKAAHCYAPVPQRHCPFL